VLLSVGKNIELLLRLPQSLTYIQLPSGSHLLDYLEDSIND